MKGRSQTFCEGRLPGVLLWQLAWLTHKLHMNTVCIHGMS